MESGILKIGEELNLDDNIYRYMSLSQFMNLVEKSKTYLTRISYWEDSWEAPSRNLGLLNEKSGEIHFEKDSICEDLFGQCWTTKKESDAMWRIYSPNKEGIKIKTSIKKLKEIQGVKFSLISKVHYYENLIDGLNYIEEKKQIFKSQHRVLLEGLIKRDAFKHEEEVRLLILNDRKYIDKTIEKGNYIDFKVNIFDFIEEISIDPRAKEYYVETIVEYCKRADFKIVPKKSDLYGVIPNKNKIIKGII